MRGGPCHSSLVCRPALPAWADTPDDAVAQIDRPDGWQNDIELTQTIGNQWLADGPCLLRVPCGLVPETENVLLNPGHRDAQSIEISDVIDFPFDQRLISARS